MSYKKIGLYIFKVKVHSATAPGWVFYRAGRQILFCLLFLIDENCSVHPSVHSFICSFLSSVRPSIRLFVRSFIHIPAGLPSCGGDVVVYVKNLKQPNLPTPFYAFIVSISVLVTLSTVFHSINSPDSSPFSHSVLPVLPLPYWSFQLYLFMKVSFSPDITLSG